MKRDPRLLPVLVVATSLAATAASLVAAPPAAAAAPTLSNYVQRKMFHRETLLDLDTLLSRVAAAPGETVVEVDGVPTRWDVLFEACSDRYTPTMRAGRRPDEGLSRRQDE